MNDNDQPQTWHYGLMAHWWDEFTRDRQNDLPFYRDCIERFGQPALDVACGVGRLLIPLMRADIDIDGCDLSPDMLTLCAQASVREKLQPHLYAQAMHMLDLPRTYQTIYLCDSFAIGGHRWQDQEAFNRIHRSLAPGGTFVFNHYPPYADDRWSYWVPGKRKTLPEPWPNQDEVKPRYVANGDGYDLQTRCADLDPLTQRMTLECRITLWRAGERLRQEQYAIQMMLYFCDEVLEMLDRAGFKQVTMHGGYHEEAVSADSAMWVFTAHKS
jgi:SAM-dependent methyltransferase